MRMAQLRHKLGLYVRRRFNVPLQEFALEHLHQAGFRPRELFDVGASSGIFADEAWVVWPALKVHCFEPEPEYVQTLQKRASQDPRLRVCPALVGAHAEPSKTYFHVLGASTLYPENRLRSSKPVIEGGGPEQQCQMITLDDYCQEHGAKPDFLKIDVQGYELEVLRGAERTLPLIDVILTEVNHIEVYAGAPLVAELIGYLAERGYALHDVCSLNRRPLDQALWQTDMFL